jgi:hypothetical protein
MRGSSSLAVRALFSTAELVLEKQWLEARDTFFGDNFAEHDFTRALELASRCQHPHAQWLTDVFAGKTVSTKRQARDIFLVEKEKNLPAALCFAAVLSLKGFNDEEQEDSEEQNLTLLRRSAELGYALAQARMAKVTSREEMFRFATLAALQRERDGFRWLGWCFRVGFGCEKNLIKAKENFLTAAELGHVNGMIDCGESVEKLDPLRWFWWGEAAKRRRLSCFVTFFAEQVREFESGSGSAAVVFQIGRALSGNVDVEKRAIFGKESDFVYRIGPANAAISFYKCQVNACRCAVDVWSLVGIRFGVVKDIRILIGRMIWETRDLALFAEDRIAA